MTIAGGDGGVGLGGRGVDAGVVGGGGGGVGVERLACVGAGVFVVVTDDVAVAVGGTEEEALAARAVCADPDAVTVGVGTGAFGLIAVGVGVFGVCVGALVVGFAGRAAFAPDESPWRVPQAHTASNSRTPRTLPTPRPQTNLIETKLLPRSRLA